MKLHDRIAALFGYRVIRARKLNDTLEDHLLNTLSLHQVNCVIDVGGCMGHYGRMLRQLGFRGRIVSFEPLSQSFTRLERTCAGDSQWRVVRAAVGAKHATVTINQMSTPQFSSCREPNAYGRSCFEESIRIVGCEDVEMTTLEQRWPEIVAGLPSPRVFLKLDTQGCDLEVLSGCGRSLVHVVGIQAEIALKPIYRGVPDYLAALERYRSHGFEVTGFYPVSRDPTSLAVIEYDCVMVRPSIAK